jgi:hypothetical protein
VCTLDRCERPVKIGELAIDFGDAAIVDLVNAYKPTKIAVDAPFGPIPFVTAVSNHAAGGRRKNQDVAALANGSRKIDRAGRELVVEAYPAAALRQWGINPRGYKGKEQQTRRHGLLAELLQRSGPYLALDRKQHELLVASDHVLDALLCALIARAALVDLLVEIPSGLRELAALEGWIAILRNHSPEPWRAALQGHRVPTSLAGGLAPPPRVPAGGLGNPR